MPANLTKRYLPDASTWVSISSQGINIKMYTPFELDSEAVLWYTSGKWGLKSMEVDLFLTLYLTFWYIDHMCNVFKWGWVIDHVRHLREASHVMQNSRHVAWTRSPADCDMSRVMQWINTIKTSKILLVSALVSLPMSAISVYGCNAWILALSTTCI